jgi:micrococcal nuclease
MKTMKKSLLIITLLFLVFAARAQKEISIDSLNRHVGDSVTVCTKIYSGIFLDRSKDSITILNAGDRYPHAPLTIIIPIYARHQFKESPELFYKDKEVCISGKIILYKGKPEIVVYAEKQIVMK